MVQVTEIAERIGPSVVGLGRGWGQGSGVVVRPGAMLTNAHVLRGPDVAVTVSGRLIHGQVLVADPRADVAVVVGDTGDAPAVPVAEDPPAIGALVYALADPGGRGLRVTHGYVAGGDVEHTAPLPRGSSGGPLVNRRGELIGLNTVRLDGGFILAPRIDPRRLDALLGGTAPRRAQLGLALTRGLTVRAVKAASPAAMAGVAPGDRLLGVDDRPLRSLDDLFDALERQPERLTLHVARGREERDIAVVLQ